MSQFSAEIIERIDLYVTGKLSAVEATQFESEMATSPALKQEVLLQQDIVEAIKMERHVQLKNKLKAIEVSSTPWYASKAFLSGAAATLMIGAASLIYYEYVKHDDSPFTNAQRTEIVSEYNEYSTDQMTDATARGTEAEDASASTESNIAATEASNSSNTTNVTEEEGTNEAVDVNAPKLSLNTEDESDVTTNSSSSLDDLESVEILKSAKADISIEVIKKSKKMYYQFYDQKLFLYGNFDGSPYEVIEIDTHFGKEFYLKFDGNYYTIKNGIIDKTPLEKILNASLINKLDELNH